jgi:hypothetical protein
MRTSLLGSSGHGEAVDALATRTDDELPEAEILGSAVRALRDEPLVIVGRAR